MTADSVPCSRAALGDHEEGPPGKPTPLLPPGRPPKMPCRLMLGRLRKLACGVDAGVGAGVLGLSWLAILCAVLISVVAAAFWSPPVPLQDNVHSLTLGKRFPSHRYITK